MRLTELRRTVARAVADRIADETGFSTAELLGNAALGIIALVAIWGVLQTLGINVVSMIGDAITSGFGG